jgi:hypothetical protein
VDRRGIEPRLLVCKTNVLPLSLAARGAQGWFRANIFGSSDRRVDHHHYLGELERPAGNDPASPRWQRGALPLSYGRMFGGQGES